VIFLHRIRSRLPYHRHWQEPGTTQSNFLDHLNLDEQGNIKVTPEFQQKIKPVLQRYRNAVDHHTIVFVPFQTIFDYLFYLKKISEKIAVVGKRGVFYSAAAVSDFYLKDVAEHKIQSSNGPMTLSFSVVPKTIVSLRKVWSPKVFLITFKLETDDHLLQKKVGVHLDGYNADVVIGNLLSSYKDKVYVCQKLHEPMLIEYTEQEKQTGHDFEEKIVAEIVKRHKLYLQSN